MRVSDAFPSNWLQASDLQGHSIPVVIEKWEMAEVGTSENPETKPAIYFKGKHKGLVLNKTNATTIASMHGEEMNDWAGREVIIFPTKTQFKGKEVDCIRIQLPMPPSANGDEPSDF